MNQKKNLAISIGQYSSAGIKPLNQDFYGAVIPESPLLTTKGIAVAIADGFSTSQVSQTASEVAVRSYLRDYYSTADTWSVKESATRVLTATNKWLYAQMKGVTDNYNRDKGFVCTFSGMVFKSNTGHLFHTGDSRVYRLVGQSLERLTEDHVHIAPDGYSYLTRAMGRQDFIEFDYKNFNLSEGDIFILATDGVYEFLDKPTLVNAIYQGIHDLDEVAHKLVEKAIAAGSDDNLTLQIIKIDALPRHGFDELRQLAMSLPKAAELTDGMEFDGFEVIRMIYRSHRSQVYLAKDIDSQQTVVLKLPAPELIENEDYIENFLLEDWVAQRINNKHVLKAIAPTRPRHYLYTVTEYIKGTSLRRWSKENPNPDFHTVRQIIEQIATGLQAFHRQDMVHQDLRPENIMIDETDVVKIIDFGATKVAGISEIQPKNEGLVGTLSFSAPEYFVGELGTRRSDIYAVAAIAYNLFSGKLPYGDALGSTQTKGQQSRLKYHSLLKEHGQAVPEWVDYAIRRATEIDPLKRYDEVSEFIYDLRHPGKKYFAKEKKPLLEKNPSLLWQVSTAVLLVIVVLQSLDFL